MRLTCANMDSNVPITFQNANIESTLLSASNTKQFKRQPNDFEFNSNHLKNNSETLRNPKRSNKHSDLHNQNKIQKATKNPNRLIGKRFFNYFFFPCNKKIACLFSNKKIPHNEDKNN